MSAMATSVRTRVTFIDSRDTYEAVAVTIHVTYNPRELDLMDTLKTAVHDYIERNREDLGDYDQKDGGWETFDWSVAFDKLKPEDWHKHGLEVEIGEMYGEDASLTEDLWPE